MDAKWPCSDTGGAAVCGSQQHESGVAVPDFRGLQIVKWLGAGLEAILVPTGPGMDWMVNVYSWYIVGQEIVHSWDIFGIWLRSVAIGADSRVRRNGRWSNHSCWS